MTICAIHNLLEPCIECHPAAPAAAEPASSGETPRTDYFRQQIKYAEETSALIILTLDDMAKLECELSDCAAKLSRAMKLMEEQAERAEKAEATLADSESAGKMAILQRDRQAERADIAEAELAECRAKLSQLQGVALFNKGEAERYQANAEKAEADAQRLRRDAERWHWARPILSGDDGADKRAMELAAGLMRQEIVENIIDNAIRCLQAEAWKDGA